MSSVIEVEDDSSDQLKGRGAGGAGGAGRAGGRGERGARAGAGAEAAWYFQRRSGGWERFDPALEKAVEDAWTKDQVSVQLCHYNFDLRLQENMQQENMQTKSKRKIKREGGPKYSATSKQLADRPGVGGSRGGSGENSMAGELVQVEYKRGDRVRVFEDQEQVKGAFQRGCDVKWQVRWREVSPQFLIFFYTDIVSHSLYWLITSSASSMRQ